MTRDTELAAAHHEAGHAIAIVLAFRGAAWLPKPAPLMPVRYVELSADGGGNCFGSDVYSMQWDIACIAPPYRPLMESQVVIELAGGVSEAIHLGEPEAWKSYCSDADLERATEVCRELRRLTGYAFEPRDFVDRTLTMLLEHWGNVTALADALVDEGRIEGDEVERIIDRSMIRRAS